MKKKINKKVKILLTCLIILLLTVIGGGIYVLKNLNDAVIETKKYNEDIDEYNKVCREYNEKAKLTSVSNIEGFEKQLDNLSKVSEKRLDVMKSLLNQNSVKKIRKDRNTLKIIVDNVKLKIKIIDYITCPNTEDIINSIKNVNEISDIRSVSKETDINGLFEKEDGGYVGCIYFKKDSINSKLFKSTDNSIIRGTDGGGSIEIFESLDDAKERCDYLDEFDGTLLNSGSYALLGTMVIRTSYMLSDEEQYDLTDKIVRAITDIR